MSNNDKSFSPRITMTNDLHRRPSSSTTLRHTSSLMNNDDTSSTSSRQRTILIMPSSAFINALVHIHNNPSSSSSSSSSSSVIPTTSTACSAPQENNDPVIGWGSIANELHVPESELLRIVERIGQLQRNRDEIISSIDALHQSIDRMQPQDDEYPSCCAIM